MALKPANSRGFYSDRAAVLLIAVVCAACATAAAGLWRSTAWGYWTAITILSLDIAGDTFNTVVNRDWRTLIGLPIGVLFIAYLRSNRRLFR